MFKKKPDPQILKILKGYVGSIPWELKQMAGRDKNGGGSYDRRYYMCVWATLKEPGTCVGYTSVGAPCYHNVGSSRVDRSPV